MPDIVNLVAQSNALIFNSIELIAVEDSEEERKAIAKSVCGAIVELTNHLMVENAKLRNEKAVLQQAINGCFNGN